MKESTNHHKKELQDLFDLLDKLVKEEEFNFYSEFKMSVYEFLQKEDLRRDELSIMLGKNIRKIQEAPPRNKELGFNILKLADELYRSLIS